MGVGEIYDDGAPCQDMSVDRSREWSVREKQREDDGGRAPWSEIALISDKCM